MKYEDDDNLPVMIFTNRRVYDRNVLKPSCPKSRALFELLGHEKTLYPWQLIWVAEMGFRYEIRGDIKQFRLEMQRMEEKVDSMEIEIEDMEEE
jgi:uncharacterized protein YcaQ